jgi:hypothetical protein
VVGGDWIGYDYSYFCPAYSFSVNGTISEPLNISGTNHISLAPNDCQEALNKARAYINERGGMTFSTSVSFINMDITFKDSIENFKNSRPLNLEKCGQTKYYIRFLYNPSKEIEYRFGIALTEDFEIISKPQFPDIKSCPDFSKTISPKTALQIAENKHKSLLNPVKSIALTYDEQFNYFIWVIRSEEKMKNYSNEYETGFARVNASSGLIIENGITKGRFLISPSF